MCGRKLCVCVCVWSAGAQFCQLTRDGEVYHDYCLNYSKAMAYIERLRKNEDFCEFEKVSGYSHSCRPFQFYWSRQKVAY